MIEREDLLRRTAAGHPYPVLFATVSGAHLYGFPSLDSDFDLRGVHCLPLRTVVGLRTGEETVERAEVVEGAEIDLVTHDAAKFFRLMLKKNGYVLEQLFSPLVVTTTPWHDELKAIGRRCVTRFHSHHYLGFAETQWKLFEKERPPRAKPLLYVYRVLLTGLHLMRTGEIETNLLRLNEDAKLPFVDDLVSLKLAGRESVEVAGIDVEFHRERVRRMIVDLEEAMHASSLPDVSEAEEPLNDLLVRLRLNGCNSP
jgi:predicted nucleotidyltransferase